MDPSTSSQAPATQSTQPDPTIHIARLSLLLQQLKTIGRTDLHPPLNGTANSVGHHLRATHQQLSQFIRIFTSQPVQDALKQARDLEASDPTIVPLTPEEEDRVYPKRRKLARRSSLTADSQDATWDRVMLQVLPPSDMLTAPDVKSSNLMEYVETLRDRTGGVIDARIWRAVKGERNHFDPPAGPCVLRVELRDTFFVYLTVAAEGSEGLRARKAVVFGLHEKRPPHLHSEYLVFKKLSQVFSSIISQRPDVPLALLIELVSLYQGMYSTNCSVCGKVMSREDRLPPLERLWQPMALHAVPKDSGDIKEPPKPSGRWIPRHVGCRS